MINLEYVLKDTDIFDDNIDGKFSEVIKASVDEFNTKSTYTFTVSFHVNLLNDSRFEEFNVPVPSKTSKGTKKDKIYEVMSFQLKRLEKVLEENGIDVYSATIQGDNLQEVNIIKVNINKDNSEPTSIGRGKNKKRMKVSSIVPSLPFTRENVTNLASDRISELFYELMRIIKNKKILSEILEIDETDDEDKLFRAYADRYGALWLTTSEKEKDLLNQLRERCILILNKYIKEEKHE